MQCLSHFTVQGWKMKLFVGFSVGSKKMYNFLAPEGFRYLLLSARKNPSKSKALTQVFAV